MAHYTGGCHCGRVRYEVSLELGKVLSCNCSMCGKKGALPAFAKASDFSLVSGESELRDYQFNKMVVHHLFCGNCGVSSFARSTHPNGTPMAAINVRCLDGVDPATLEVQHFDGKRL